MTRASSVDRFRSAVQSPGAILISGEVQFWRMDPANWRRALLAVKDVGIDHIASYLSWRRHEPAQGSFDLRGAHGRELDVHAFLDLCSDLDISVQLKPGPWICAEEKGGGFPDWILEDESLMALDHEGQPVSGYNPPFKHPMPSYASSRFRSLTARWYEQVWTDLADFVAPGGPIVATQLDNEPSLGFQDSMYGFDYHPESIEAFRRFVRTKYEGLAGTREPIDPPKPNSMRGIDSRDQDWIEYQEVYIAEYLGWLQDLNASLGVGHLLDFVNLNTHPVRGMPQSGARIAARLHGSESLAVVGEDHYFEPPVDRVDIAGLALAAAQASATCTSLLWAPEVQSGIWRSPGEVVEYPDPTAHDLVTWWALALAFGYQGFNLYMLVERENWEFAPISEEGLLRPLAEDLRRLIATVESVPGLASYRPVADCALPWPTDVRRRAYRVRGTQGAPLAPWDSETERRDYDWLVSEAQSLTNDGIQFELSSAKDVLSYVKPARPHVRVEADQVVVRMHATSHGAEILYVISMSKSSTPVIVVWQDGRTGRLRNSISGETCGVVDGVASLTVAAGLSLFMWSALVE